MHNCWVLYFVQITIWRSCIGRLCACNIYQHVKCLMVADFTALEALYHCFVERWFSLPLQGLRFAHWCYRIFKSTGMPRHFVGWVASDVVQAPNTFSLTLKMNTLQNVRNYSPSDTVWHPRRMHLLSFVMSLLLIDGAECSGDGITNLHNSLLFCCPVSRCQQ